MNVQHITYRLFHEEAAIWDFSKYEHVVCFRNIYSQTQMAWGWMHRKGDTQVMDKQLPNSTVWELSIHNLPRQYINRHKKSQLFTYTVPIYYNAINIVLNHQNTHPIAGSSGLNMDWLLWIAVWCMFCLCYRSAGYNAMICWIVL